MTLSIRSPLLQNRPFDLGYSKGIQLRHFDTVIIDYKSIQLVKLGGNEQRYAFIGWFKDYCWHIRIRPGFSYTTDPTVKALAEQKFGENNYVFSEEKNPGIVHRILEKQVRHDEPQLTLPDKKNPYVTQIAGSFYKLKDDTLLWINRSTANMNVCLKNELALSCYTFSDLQTDFRRPSHTEDYDLIRSIDELAFKKLAEKATVLLGHKTASYHGEKIFLSSCTSFAKAKQWNAIAEKTMGVDKHKALEEMLMRTIYIASGINQDASGEGLYPVVLRSLKLAKSENIKLNLEWVPPGFNQNQPALFVAAAQDYEEVVKLLIDYGAKAYFVNAKGDSAPLYAIKYYFKFAPQYFDALLSSNKSLDHPSIYKLNPLYVATRLQDDKLVKKLLEKKANPNVLCNEETALISATRDQEFRLTQILLDHKADPNLQKSSSLGSFDYILKHRNVLLLKKLLEAKLDLAKLDQKGESPLFKAVTEDSPRIVKHLLTAKSDPNLECHGVSPLTEAVELNSETIALKLLKKGANPNFKDPNNQYPIMTAVQHKNLCLVETLVEYKADCSVLTPNRDNLLHLAVKANDLFIFRYLLSLKIACDTPNNEGQTPLLIAMQNANSVLIEEILNVLKIPAQNFMKAFYKLTAYGKNFSAIIETFETIMKNPSSQNFFFETQGLIRQTYSTLAETKNPHTVTLLVKKLLTLLNGFIPGSDEQTFLIIAIKHQSSSLVRLLLSMGADPSVCNNKGESPLLLAIQAGNFTIIKEILKHDKIKGLDFLPHFHFLLEVQEKLNYIFKLFPQETLKEHRLKLKAILTYAEQQFAKSKDKTELNSIIEDTFRALSIAAEDPRAKEAKVNRGKLNSIFYTTSLSEMLKSFLITQRMHEFVSMNNTFKHSR